jgi:hypothetical protein
VKTIVVVDYDPAWPGRFEELRGMFWQAISDFAISIEHVGSTSVPGLAAKPRHEGNSTSPRPGFAERFALDSGKHLDATAGKS